MVSLKLYLCVFFAFTLQMVAVNANEKLMSYVAEELRKDAHNVREKLESLKYLLEHKMAHTEKHYHINMDKLIADTELRIVSMLCKEGTMDKVKTVREYGWGSFKQCVELTRAFADGEVVVYDTVVYLEGVLQLLENITKGVAACRNESLFQAMSCVVETIANHSGDYKNKTDAILSLFSRMDNITHEIYSTFRNCLGNVHTTVSLFINDIIAKNCEEESFFKKLLNSIKSRFSNTPKFSLLKKTPTEEENRQKTPTKQHRQNTPSEEHRQKTPSEEDKN